MTTINPVAAAGTGAFSKATSNDALRARARRRGKLGKIGVYAGIVAIVIYCLAPFYWMVVSSFRRTSDLFSTSLIPHPFSLDGYRDAFNSGGLPQALLNSLIVAGVTTILGLLIAIATAYACARLNFRFKTPVMAIIIATSMFPGITLVVPLFKFFSTIGWINTYQSMILPYLSFIMPLAVFNLTAFFKQLPFELEESAKMDGCTPLQAFRRVILPLAAPGVFTTAMIVFIAAWNEFIIATSMVNNKSRETAPVAISQFSGVSSFVQPFGEQMAAGVIVTIPLVILVLLFQRRIVAGLTAGAVK
jgi:multiple sugar transport system permease protein